jgi:chromosome partitioning protein
MIITITNNKGGVGKSTTAQTLSIGLAQKGKKVLLIDLDPQCNTSNTFKVNQMQNNIYKVLKNECNISDAIYTNKVIDLISSSLNLSSLEYEFNINQEYQFIKHKMLKMQLDKIKDNYDFIIIDTAPNLSLMTTNAIYSSDYVLIPMLADIYSIQGLNIINNQIKAIREGTDNKQISICGILLTHYKSQTIVNQSLKDALNEVASQIDTKVYKNVIRDSVIFSDSQASNSVCLMKYPNHNASIDYINFIDEFLKDMEVNKNE